MKSVLKSALVISFAMVASSASAWEGPVTQDHPAPAAGEQTPAQASGDQGMERTTASVHSDDAAPTTQKDEDTSAEKAAHRFDYSGRGNRF